MEIEVLGLDGSAQPGDTGNVAPSVSEISRALAKIVTDNDSIGIYDSTIATDPDYAVLRELQLVTKRLGPYHAEAEHAAAELPAVVDAACSGLDEGIAAILRAYLGLGPFRGADKGRRHREANTAKTNHDIGGNLRKTLRDDVLTALATELRRMELDCERSSVLRALEPRVRERLDIRLEVARAHLAHLNFQLPLIPLRATIHHAPEGFQPESDHVDAVLDAWLSAKGESNLAVVLGSFGSGKSGTLVRAVERVLATPPDPKRRTVLFSSYQDLLPPAGSGDDLASDVLDRLADQYFTSSLEAGNAKDQLLTSLPELVVAIDDFDAGWVGRQRAPAHQLGQLRHLLQKEGRLLISSRRHFAMRDDPLIAQLREPLSYTALGVVDPLILELCTPTSQDLRTALGESVDPAVARVLQYLESFDPGEVEHLFRPLLVEMLLLVPDLPQARPISVAELYRRYANIVLLRDHDQQRSVIPATTKHHILTRIAGHMLRPADDEDSDRVGATGALLELEVTEAAMATGLDVSAPGTNLTDDFLDHNHFLVTPHRARGSHEFRLSQFDFSHPTFFEYFASEDLVARAERGQLFELPESQRTEAVFDSLIAYFMKAYLLPAALVRLRKVARRQHLGDLDRLLTIFLLEDDEELKEILDQVPDNYRKFLEVTENRSAGFFLKKVTKYQLVLIENSESRAFDYVNFVREREDLRHRDLEDRLFSTTSSAEDFLLRRLRNPRLTAARPIAIYRLGEFGGPTALQVLRDLATEFDASATEYLALINEAIERIEGCIIV